MGEEETLDVRGRKRGCFRGQAVDYLGLVSYVEAEGCLGRNTLKALGE